MQAQAPVEAVERVLRPQDHRGAPEHGRADVAHRLLAAMVHQHEAAAGDAAVVVVDRHPVEQRVEPIAERAPPRVGHLSPVGRVAIRQGHDHAARAGAAGQPVEGFQVVVRRGGRVAHQHVGACHVGAAAPEHVFGREQRQLVVRGGQCRQRAAQQVHLGGQHAEALQARRHALQRLRLVRGRLVVVGAHQRPRGRQQRRPKQTAQQRVVVVAPTQPRHARAGRRAQDRVGEDGGHAVRHDRVRAGHVAADQRRAEPPLGAVGDAGAGLHELQRGSAAPRDQPVVGTGKCALEQIAHQRNELLVAREMDDPHRRRSPCRRRVRPCRTPRRRRR